MSLTSCVVWIKNICVQNLCSKGLLPPVSKQNAGICSQEFQPLVIWSLLNISNMAVIYLVISFLLRALENIFLAVADWHKENALKNV